MIRTFYLKVHYIRNIVPFHSHRVDERKVNAHLTKYHERVLFNLDKMFKTECDKHMDLVVETEKTQK